MNIEQTRELPLLLKHFNLPMVAIEVGVAGGSLSQEFLEGGVEKIFCVDNWGHIENVTGDGNFPDSFHAKTFEEYNNRFNGIYKNRVVTLKGLSSEMHKYIPDNLVGLCFIDGGHQYEVVKSDIENYLPKLVHGGIMSLHDYFNEGYGVKQAVNEFLEKTGLTLNIIPAENPNAASVWIRIN